jgi:cytochrome c oxidase assembly protein subunit 15
MAALLAAVVVVLGAYTRLVDAGLGCPDWPGCYGFFSVPETSENIGVAEARFPDAPVEVEKAWAEMVHRYFATTLGFVILVMAFLSFMARRRAAKQPEFRDLPVKLPLFLVLLVIVQGAFGAWTVTLKLWPQVVTAHLLGGFTTLSLLFLLALRQGLWANISLPGGLKNLARISLAVLIVQIALGGWVSSNYAALACGDFPTCQGELVPEMDLKSGFNLIQDIGPNYLGGKLNHLGRVAIHFSHRLGALIAFVLIAWLSLKIWRHHPVLGAITGATLLVQVGLGISNILFAIPLTVATTHNAIGAGLLLVLVSVNFFVHRGGREQFIE